MKLSKQDADLVFDLIWSLQAYVNRKLKLIPGVIEFEDFALLPDEQKLEAREALYDNIDLIDDYVQENPDGFKAEELEIVRGWKRLIRGEFFIERLLKKYAIFIGSGVVYGVLGLYDSFEEVLPYGVLPLYTRAVLLPFKGKIIYDGLLEGYNVYFGGGIKADLRETYMAAKQKGIIIESLDPQAAGRKPARKKKPIKDWRPELEAIAEQADKLRSGAGSPPIYSPAFSLAKASIAFARSAVDRPHDLDALWKALEKVERQLRRAETTLFREEY